MLEREGELVVEEYGVVPFCRVPLRNPSTARAVTRSSVVVIVVVIGVAHSDFRLEEFQEPLHVGEFRIIRLDLHAAAMAGHPLDLLQDLVGAGVMIAVVVLFSIVIGEEVTEHGEVISHVVAVGVWTNTSVPSITVEG